MWLINVATKKLEYFDDSKIPKYVILSHTWEDDEVSFQDIHSDSPKIKDKKGYAKIIGTCDAATKQGLDYAWVDTCCIDKSSSAELSEAINSMWRWYRKSEFCIAYLSDFPSKGSINEHLAKCRWFTRGWTLQELIAPDSVVFVDEKWQTIGRKATLGSELESITGIPRDFLAGKGNIQSFSIAMRMSWAAKRKTTRIEDTAYCLLGIFDIAMPLLYGEGDKAFLRLQEEIVRRNNDASLFCWKWADIEGVPEPPVLTGIFAPSPVAFANSKFPPMHGFINQGISINNRGIQTRTRLGIWPSPASNTTCILPLGLDEANRVVSIYLRQLEPFYFARYFPDSLPYANLSASVDIAEDVLIPVKPHAISYGWHRGPPPDRTAALRINLQTENLGGNLRLTGCNPRHHWDSHDQCFFATRDGPCDWAIFSISGLATTHGVEIPLQLICACFGWNKASTQPVISVIANGYAIDQRDLRIMDLYLRMKQSDDSETVVMNWVGQLFGRQSMITVETNELLINGRKRLAAVSLVPSFTQEGTNVCLEGTVTMDLDIRLEDILQRGHTY